MFENFVVSKAYSKKDICNLLGHNNFYGGINYSQSKDIIVLIINEDSIYNDVESGNTVEYRGEGQENDQTPTRGNKRLEEFLSDENKREHICLFKKIEKNQYIYEGRVKPQNTQEISTIQSEKDANNNLRKVIVFPLVLVDK